MEKETDLTTKITHIEKEVQPALYEQSFDKTGIKNDAEHELNDKILKITMTIKDKYPELSKYLNEMPDTIPDEKSPEITLNNLKVYYESLNSMLNKYMLEHESKS